MTTTDANDVPPLDESGPEPDTADTAGSGSLNYYIVLGVRSSATPDDIKAAYRRLSRELHPDVNPDPDAAKRFRDVKEAYDVLSNTAKRKKYDDDLASAQAGDSGSGGNGPTGPPPPADPPRFDTRDEYPPPSSPFDVAVKLYQDRALGDRMSHIWAHRGNWMVWKTTCWVEVDLAELRQAVYTVLAGKWYWRLVAKVFEPTEWSPNKHKVADVLEALAAVTHLSSRIDPPAWTDSVHSAMATQIISCRNGLFDLSTRTLVKHTADLYNLVSVPLDYDADAPDPITEWLKFLKSLWGDDEASIALLQEWMGYVLSGRLEQHKMLLMLGPIRSGKGTIARTLQKLMGGKDNVAGPTLAQLGTNFGLASLLGKPLAIISDARLGDTPSHVVVERLLSITGEDTLDVDRKFRDVCTGKLPTRLVILSNELPKFRDASAAIATRMLILRMTESFLNREDKELEQKLAPELGGILKWSLEGLERLNKNGRFTVPKSSDDAAVLMMDLASPMSAFVRQKCLTDLARAKDIAKKHNIDPTTNKHWAHELGIGLELGELWVSRDEAYAAWLKWAEANGHMRTAKSTFGRDLRSVVAKIKDRRKREIFVDNWTGGTTSRQVHGYAYIALLPDSLDSDDDDAGQNDESESGHPDSVPDSPDSEPGSQSAMDSESRGESRHPDSPDGVKPQVNDGESGESGTTPISVLSKNSERHTEAEKTALAAMDGHARITEVIDFSKPRKSAT
jgi:putative DNA primase/helicase